MEKELVTRKKNGFTLIELLATIAVLALVAVISMTFGSNIYSQSKEKALEAMNSSIVKAARLYYIEEQKSGTVCVTVEQLKSKGYIKESELKDAKDKYGFKYTDNSGVKITQTNGIINTGTFKSC